MNRRKEKNKRIKTNIHHKTKNKQIKRLKKSISLECVATQRYTKQTEQEKGVRNEER